MDRKIKSTNVKKNTEFTDEICKSGLNTGNMAFVYAIKRQLKFSRECWLTDELVNCGDEICVLTASNFMDPSFKEIEDMADFLDRNKTVNVVLAGVGAQAKLNDTPAKLVKKLTKKQKRFFQIIGSRSATIGVRGEFTAECMKKIGVNNIRIIGCPSYYASLENENEVLQFKKPSDDKIVVNIAPLNAIASKILKMGMDCNGEWIMQTLDEFSPSFKKNRLVATAEFMAKFELPISGIGWGGVKISEVENYVQKHSRFFLDMEEWNQFLTDGNYTFSFGTRFHGNMIAYRNGIPALWIVHDMRTKELTEALELPYIGIKEFKNIKQMQELLHFADYSCYSKIYEKKLQNYLKFLQENQLLVN